MCRNCIVVLFLPLCYHYTLIFKPNYLLQKCFSLKQMKQTTHQVSCQSLLNHNNFSAGLCIKQGSSRGSFQRFSSSSLQLNPSIILLFSELMENEPRRHLVQNGLHSTFAVEQLPIHFLRASCTEKRNIEKTSITVSVRDFFFFK